MLAWRGELTNDEVCGSLALAVILRGPPYIQFPKFMWAGYPHQHQQHLQRRLAFFCMFIIIFILAVWSSDLSDPTVTQVSEKCDRARPPQVTQVSDTQDRATK